MSKIITLDLLRDFLTNLKRLFVTKDELTAHATAAESTYVQTGAVDQTIGGTKTFSKPIAGSVTGSSGSCTGNAATATKATSNANGKELTNTIIKGLSISGKTITYTQIDGNTGTLTTQDTVYTHPTTAGNKHIPSGGSSGQFLGWASDGTAKWVNNPNTNTDTLMTQNVSTTNATYPVLLVATADATANQGAKTGIFAKSVKVNPSTNVISASGFSGPLTGNVTGNCSGSSGSCTGNAATATTATTAKACTGNAATATKLQTARTINGIKFDGTANITIPATVPAGAIIPFAGTSVPTGYLLCNGAAVSRTDYANLFAAIGTLYGAGDGSTTFNLPDARDRVLQGASGTHSAGSYIAAGLPNITGEFDHGVNRAAIQTTYGAFYGDKSTVMVPSGSSSSTGRFPQEIYFSAHRSNAIYGASSTVQQPAIATNFIIKY